jgi:hypothetical protein
MNAETESETLFTAYCRANGISYRRIQASNATGERSPDYVVRLSGHAVVVEVKQLDESPFDRDMRDRLRKHGQTGPVTPPLDKRIRKKIDRAMPQLRRLAKRRRPALLVLYDNASFFTPGGLEVRLAMYGKDHVDVLLADTPKGPVAWIRHRFGAGQKVAPTFNTSLSGVALLSERRGGPPGLAVYHNRYARQPLDPDWIRSQATVHYRLGNRPGPGGLMEWETF